MEFVMLVCSATLQEELEQLFKKNKITGYTQLPVVHGSGQGGGTRLDTEVWPGMNTMYILAISESQYLTVKNWVKDYRGQKVREGIKLFTLGLKEML